MVRRVGEVVGAGVGKGAVEGVGRVPERVLESALEKVSERVWESVLESVLKRVFGEGIGKGVGKGMDEFYRLPLSSKETTYCLRSAVPRQPTLWASLKGSVGNLERYLPWGLRTGDFLPFLRF